MNFLEAFIQLFSSPTGSKRALRKAVVIFSLISGLGIGTAHSADDLYFASVGSGGLDGGYYNTAKAICGAVNAVDRQSIRCSQEATPGSIYNLRGLANGELEFAIVQSDWLDAAYTGTSVFANYGPNQNLLRVASLYVEAFTILARRDAQIFRFEDLIGKRVDIGPAASGRRATANVALKAFDISLDSLASISELPNSSIVSSLCDGLIDASVLVVGHPSGLVAEALATCDIVIVQLAGPTMRAFLEQNPQYRATQIPADTYPEVSYPIATMGVTAILVTNTEVPENVVERFASSLKANWERWASASPVLAAVRFDDLQKSDMHTPVHPVAVATFGLE